MLDGEQGVLRQLAAPHRQGPLTRLQESDLIHLWVFYYQSVLAIKRLGMMWQAPLS